MSNLFTSTTVLLTEEFVKSCSKETLQSKLTKLRLVTGIQFNKANKSYAVAGSWEQVDAAFNILNHWQDIPEHEPGFENALDGKIEKLCECHIISECLEKHRLPHLQTQSESESRIEKSDKSQSTNCILESSESVNLCIEQTVAVLTKEYANIKDKLKFRRKDLKQTTRKSEKVTKDNRPLKCNILNKHKNDVEHNTASRITNLNTHIKLKLNTAGRQAKEKNGQLLQRDNAVHNKSTAITQDSDIPADQSYIGTINITGHTDLTPRHKRGSLPNSESENHRLGTSKFIESPVKSDNVKVLFEKPALKKLKKPGDKGYWSRAKRNDINQIHHCQECNVTLKSRKRYLEHMRRIHIREYQCKLCEKRFGYPTDLNRHKCAGVTTNEKKDRLKSKGIISSGSSEFQCVECNYTTPVKMRLSCHIQRTHRKEFACDQCDRRFGYSKDLLKHKQNIHSGTYFFCDQCSKTYKNKQMFDSHLKTHQADYVKPIYECEDCPKSFVSKHSLTVHMKTVHLGIKKVYLCQMCGKKFSQRSSYKQHCNAHNGVKPYKCDICDKAFVYHKSLKEHKYMHDDIRRFFCIYCNKAFRQRTTLHVHLKTHKTVKDHVCSVCGRGFAQKQAMERHERIHTGVRPYTCLVCNKSFGDTSTIRRHMISLHQKTETNWRKEILSTVKKKSDYYVFGGTGQNREFKSNPSTVALSSKKETSSVSHTKSSQAQNPVQPAQTDLVPPESSLILLNPAQSNGIQENKIDYVNVVNGMQGTSVNGNVQNLVQSFQTFHTLQPGTLYAIATCQSQQNQQQNLNSATASPVSINNGINQVIDFSTMAFVATKLPNQGSDKFENREQLPMQVQSHNSNVLQNATIVPLSPVAECLKVGQTGPATQVSADSSLSQAIGSVWGFVGYPSYQSQGHLKEYQPSQNQ